MKFTPVTTTNPKKAGVYAVKYCRAKSKEEQIGTAVFKTRDSSYYNKGWNRITGPRGPVSEFVSDTRDNRVYRPAVVAWGE